MTMRRSLYGLVLAGGHSRACSATRRRCEYAGEPQLQRAMESAASVGRARFHLDAAGPAQRPAARRLRGHRRSDRPISGPIGGIQAALHAHPHSAWLVLACDLPFLDRATLERPDRPPRRRASCDRLSQQPRWHARAAVRDLRAGQPRSHRRSGSTRGSTARANGSRSSDVACSICPSRARSTTSTPRKNTPTRSPISGSGHHWRQRPSPASRRLQVRYFALLREQAGRSAEELQTGARTPLELYEELRRRRGLALGARTPARGDQR